MPSLDLVDETTTMTLFFVGATVTWCVFVLQDAVLTGLRQAVWVPVENGVFSLVKLGLLAVFAASFPRQGIFASWAIGAIVTLVPVTILIFARLVPRHVAAPTAEAPPSLRDLTRFVAPDYLGALGWLAAVTVVPLIIIERAGPTENAYFALAWVVVLPLFFVSASMGSSLVVSAASEPHLLPGHLRRMLVQTAVIVLPLVAVVVVGAPYLLRIFGDAYSENGTALLRLLALSAVPHIPIALAINAARVRRRMRTVVAIQVAECTAVLGLTWVLLGRYGVEGAGWAWLVAQTAVAAAVVLWARVADRLVPVLGQVRAAAEGNRRARALRPLIADILSTEGLEQGRLLAAPASDTIVVAAGTVALKLSATAAGSKSLRREIQVLGRLSADPRLAEWRSLLPEVLTAGEQDGLPYLVQRLAPGVDGRQLGSHSALLAQATEAIGELHRLTAGELEVGAEVLDRWVDRPLAELQGRQGVEHVRARLHRGLAGLTLRVGWIHGDFVPGNVLVDGGRVSAIIDWDRAAPDDLPVLDHLQFALAMRRGELGRLVVSVLQGAPLDEVVVPEPLDLRTAVLLTWLRHVSANLEKSTRYASSRPWLAANVTPVLREVAS